MFLNSLTLCAQASHHFESPSQHRKAFLGETTVDLHRPRRHGMGHRRKPRAAAAVRGDVASPVTVWPRTLAKAERHAAAFGTRCARTLSDASRADVVITCLPTSAEVAAVVAGSWRQHLKLAVCGSTARGAIPTQQGRRGKTERSASRWSTLP